ncbi:hypothetical protein COLO4_36773 [Corchorus olitorius]|uniref:SET domain-containing protein n=1 Tax=Corchorus olitorius TaxID=93759 RepID=A0A1R3G5I3_9ROSI|nr:hypothetical protein COLO4_36773 [Corchorus olitorius]
MVETASEIINTAENTSNLKGDSYLLGSICVGDKSASLPCQPSLDIPDVMAKDFCAAVSSSGSIDCSGQRGNEGKDDVGADCVSETKNHPNPSSSSRRGSRKSKCSRKTRAKRVAGNCRKTKQLNPESIECIFEASRRKRSCSSKPARSSTWGLSSNVTQFLEQSHEPEGSAEHTQEISKAGRFQGSKNGATANNRKGSSGTSNTSCLLLRIKVGKEATLSNINGVVVEPVDMSVSVDTCFSNNVKETSLCPELANVVEGKGGKLGSERQFQSKDYSDNGKETSLCPELANVVEDKGGQLGSERQFQSKDELEKVVSDASIMDSKVAKEVLLSAENLEKSAEDARYNDLVNLSDTVAQAASGEVENKYMDPGTSPDSEVINLIPDTQVGSIHQEELPHTVMNTSGALALPEGVKGSKKSKSSKKGKKDAANVSKPKSSKNCRGRQKTTGKECCSGEALTSPTGANSLGDDGLGVCQDAMKVETSIDAKACCSPDAPDTKNNKKMSSSKNKRNQLSKSSKSQGVSKGKSKVSTSARSKKVNACNRGGNELKSVGKGKVEEKRSDEEIEARGGGHQLTVAAAGNCISVDIENSNTSNSIASAEMSNIDLVSDDIENSNTQADDAWVRCDDCHKWRRIPVSLVKSIDDSCRWICGDNVDKAFADCSIPQEKSNADINAELGISDAEEDGYDGLNYKELEKEFESKCTTESPSSHFWRIESNQFLHRARKTQTIDEIMVCHCKRPLDGKLGCGDECLNRMLNIECVQGTCPCGDLCSNQQFQTRKYAKMKWDKCGKKGFGLRMLENISAGHFLIEYVGEVLDMQAYEARQKEYAARGQRHFYFMTLNGSEVIDACVKGNLGRFINHSCDPNCRTEKWMVNGEICIGLFALRDIKKGEELTFDYNYVRVFGAAAKKCHCGSPHCRGYIGGDPLSAEVIVHDDSDEESPEPMMLEDGETWNGSVNITSRSSSVDAAEMLFTESVITDCVIKLENTTEVDASAKSELKSSVETEDLKGSLLLSNQPEEVSPMTALSEATADIDPDGTMEKKAINKTSSSAKKLDTSLNILESKLSSDTVDVNKKSKLSTPEGKQVVPKSRPLMKTSRSCSSGSIKEKITSNSLNGNKVQIKSIKAEVPSVKPKKLLENPSNCRFEAVAEKLNELLDSDGGITRRKDASKGYLKLLLLTATSGDSGNGEAIQSNRELSMILDALLKTKSRLVLTDIINKNGLQMLHNIMKKYRRDFKKIPILRKLLKVLEYLAMREILTLDHIYGGPPCPGRESFRQSMLSLTEHDDKQVHQIARNFRDKWIPKPARRLNYRDKDEGRMDFHRGLDSNRVSASHNHWRDQAIRPAEEINSVVSTTSVDTAARDGCSSSSTVICQTNGTKTRKRKSRWDQPADPEKIDSRSPKKSQYSSLPVSVESTPNQVDRMSRADGEAINVDNGRHSFQDDVPPGFSSLPNATALSTATDFHQPNCQSKCSGVIIAHPQKRFISRLPVSYGIPLSILQQFGSPQGEEKWIIAPGMPFHPFPPLPPGPRDKKDAPPACTANFIGTNQDAEGKEKSHQPSGSYSDGNIPSTTGGNQADAGISGSDVQQTHKRTRECYDLSQKYFRQQKRKGPPWQKSECMGNNYIDGTGCIDVKNELSNS